MKQKEPLVSVITPVGNSSRFLKETIKNVQDQTYKNGEMILVDDCSTDNSAEIIEEFAKKDKRIRYEKLSKNSGAAVARNRALELAKGRFIAYLDSDDIGTSDKTEYQVSYMLEHKYGFTCCDYDKCQEDGTSLNKVIHMPETINYRQLLGNTIIQTVGVMVDTEIIDRKLLQMPLIRKRQDSATWAQILKPGNLCYRVPKVLATYRVVKGSLSANKFVAFKYNGKGGREIEHLDFFTTCLCTVSWGWNAVKKRIYFR